ncbi:hypothetical protein B7P43_G07843 [Cryptotermes secundus]|uniref:Uncharacterized protein n=1 Tax=Cryptotermes secundus TaxID=105785 RepID=A0A2J7QEZ7_9NEOP|nr:hypothetical protein B7P43_G07843 [Cryptotermes secundus]
MGHNKSLSNLVLVMSVRCWCANQQEIKKWENIVKRRHPKGETQDYNYWI